MQKKIATLTTTLLALGAVASPSLAEGGADDLVVEDAVVEESTEGSVDDLSMKELRAAAREARKEARDLAKAESSDDADVDESETEESDEADKAEAREALEAARDRLLEEGTGGNGVAADVLTALLEGESPAGIGAEHGAEMAAAAAERRDARAEERAQERAEEGKGKPDHAGPPEGRGNGRP